MLRKYTCVSDSQALRMRYPFQSTGRPISQRNVWSFRVYMIQLRNFVPEWNSRSGTATGVKSHRGDSRRHDILWWYLVNKYRAIRGNRSQRSELALARKSLRCHDCKHPLRGCLHDTGATFAPDRAHSSSLSWLYICLHDTTTKCHAGASHPGVRSPQLLYRGKNFTPLRNLATWSKVKFYNDFSNTFRKKKYDNKTFENRTRF